jgi:hypothetical protein
MPVRDEPWPPGTPCWVDAQVADTTAARDFYGRLFGWEIYDGPEEAGGYLMAYKNDKVVAGIGPRPDDLTTSMWSTYLAADDVDALAPRITAAGGSLAMAPTDVLDAGRMLIAVDPTGATFGAWQAGRTAGAAVHNEHGAYCWNDLHTPDFAGARDFYAAVFGYTYEDIGDGVTLRYATFTPPGGEGPVGGINDDTLAGGERPAYWLTWFQVDDVDAATALATELGGHLLTGPDTTPFGRTASIEGPQGEVFGLLTPLGG